MVPLSRSLPGSRSRLSLPLAWFLPPSCPSHQPPSCVLAPVAAISYFLLVVFVAEEKIPKILFNRLSSLSIFEQIVLKIASVVSFAYVTSTDAALQPRTEVGQQMAQESEAKASSQKQRELPFSLGTVSLVMSKMGHEHDVRQVRGAVVP